MTQTPQHDSSPELTAAWLDEAVAASRSLCQRFADDLPDRSALRGLVSFAQTTPSPAEAVLFVRYQATRLPKGKRFLPELATTLEQRYAGDIHQLRRFLGVMVRAGIVQLAMRQPSRTGRDDRRPAPRTAPAGPPDPRRQPRPGRRAP
jgi:hypothetical protein